MKSDDIEQLKELVAFLKENDIAEFDLDRGDYKVRLKFASAVVQPAAAAVPQGIDYASLARFISPGMAGGSGMGTFHSQAGPANEAFSTVRDGSHGVAGQGQAGGRAVTTGAAPEEDEALHIIKSPIVGTFYESPSPGSSAFVTNGDRIEKGQVVCIVEAMKLMNEIEADAAGEIVKRLVNNGQPVEYGQPLFAIRIV